MENFWDCIFPVPVSISIVPQSYHADKAAISSRDQSQISDASSHRWRDTKRFVKSREIVVHKVECDHRDVIVEFLREAVRLNRVRSSHPHTPAW